MRLDERDSSGNMRNLRVQRINAPHAADFPLGQDLAQLLPELQIALRENGTYQQLYEKWFGSE